MRFILSRRATLLADEMGLGKSCQAILAFSMSDSAQMTVVCPAYLRFNWEREFAFWLPGYDQNRLKTYSYDTKPGEIPPPEFLAFDEVHYLKNDKSQRFQRWEPVARSARKLVALTGTPIPNRIRELFPLLSLLDAKTWNPEKLGNTAPATSRPHPFAALMNKGLVAPSTVPVKAKSYSRDFFTFAKRYCGAKLIEIPGKGQFAEGSWQPKTAWSFDGASHLDELNQRLRSTIMIRRTKEQVLPQLPAKRRQIIVLPRVPPECADSEWMQKSDLTEENYDEFVKRLEADKVKFKDWSETRHRQGKAKIPYVIEHLQDCFESGSRKIIVFGHHIDVLEELYAVLNFDGAVLITGQTPKTQRTDAIDVFQDDPNCHFFVGSIGASGTGINLTSASHVVFAEFDPAPYRLLQAEDRAHRMGQRKMVLVQHVVWNGSLDARMAKIVMAKLEVQNAALR